MWDFFKVPFVLMSIQKKIQFWLRFQVMVSGLGLQGFFKVPI
jgi:hypothetical protein